MNKLLLLLYFLACGIILHAQNIGVNTSGNPAHSSAMLDVEASDKGLLIPRISIPNLNNAAPVTAPQTSLLVYNTNTSTGVGYYYWSGTAWIKLLSSSPASVGDAWLLTGNAGTNPTNNFLGTIDNQALVLRTNNSERVRVLSNGRVGIATTNPQGFTHILHSSSTIPTLRIEHNSNSANNVALDIHSQGQVRASFTPSGLGRFANGTAALPSVSFHNNVNTGMFRPALNNLAFSTNGVERMKIWQDGRTMVNLTAPVDADMFSSAVGGTASAITGYHIGTGQAVIGLNLGGGDGVWGEASASGGDGVVGLANNINGLGLFATNLTSGGDAIWAISEANSSSIFSANIGNGEAVYGFNSDAGVGVVGESAGANGFGVIGLAQNNASYSALFLNDSNDGDAVLAISGENEGVAVAAIGGGIGQGAGIYGEGAAGVIGVSELTDGTGVFAVGNDGNQVNILPEGSGLAATGFNGVYASANDVSGTGIVAVGNNVSGYSVHPSGSGVAALGATVGVFGRASNSSGERAGGIFQINSSPGGGLTADVRVAARFGTSNYKIIGWGSVSTIVEDLNEEPVIMFAPESPEVLFQDYGIGKLQNGKAYITLDPIFSKNINVSDEHPIKVFIQLEGDCNGVYVTNKSSQGFEVIELSNGKSNVSFSWSVTATRANQKIGNEVSDYSMRFPKYQSSVMDTSTQSSSVIEMKRINRDDHKFLIRPKQFDMERVNGRRDQSRIEMIERRNIPINNMLE